MENLHELLCMSTQYDLPSELNEVYKSCEEAMDLNGNNDGFYRIQLPSMKQNVTIQCKRVDGQPTSVFHHDIEQTIQVTGYEDAQSYR